jgi:membrane carboxypeptidase/penicillin-binding protein
MADRLFLCPRTARAIAFVDFPKQLINAFLSAEDKTFWSHGGVDLTGLGQAVVDYATKFGSGERARGGSTITQQVAKNILIGNEYSVSASSRKCSWPAHRKRADQAADP